MSNKAQDAVKSKIPKDWQTMIGQPVAVVVVDGGQGAREVESEERKREEEKARIEVVHHHN